MRFDPSRLTFVVDFDGTIAPVDTVDSLLNRFADSMWESIEEDWIQGKLDSRACLKGQLDLVKADRATLEAFFHAVEIDPTFVHFVKYVGTFANIAVVSDGLDYPITHLMQKWELSSIPVFANKMHFTKTGVDLSFPHSHSECLQHSGVCKCAVARSLGGEATILIGDGRSDRCLARSADYVFAKGSLQRFCESENIPHIPFSTFDDVVAAVRRWRNSQYIVTNRKSRAL